MRHRKGVVGPGVGWGVDGELEGGGKWRGNCITLIRSIIGHHNCHSGCWKY